MVQVLENQLHCIRAEHIASFVMTVGGETVKRSGLPRQAHML